MGETDGEVGEGVRGFGDGWHGFIFGGVESDRGIVHIAFSQEALFSLSFGSLSFLAFLIFGPVLSFLEAPFRAAGSPRGIRNAVRGLNKVE